MRKAELPMPSSDPKTLVSTGWLSAHLSDPDLRIIDGSWYMLGSGRDALSDYDAAHIPGARFVDIDDLSDESAQVPHMAPPPEKFASRMCALGIGDGHQVVIYDGAGLFSAARIWWLFRLMGKRDVAVLDGGFPKWRAEGRAIEDMAPIIRDRHMTVQRQAHLARNVTQVAAASKLGDHTILDARSTGRFRGDEAEPRPGLRSGHIPGSRSLPFGRLLNENGTMKDVSRLREILAATGADLDKPVIATCGSGVTAAIITLALERIGHKNHSLYDGSWAEWGAYDDLKIATGEA